MHYSYIIMSCTPEHAQNAVVDVWLDKLARLHYHGALVENHSDHLKDKQLMTLNICTF